MTSSTMSRWIRPLNTPIAIWSVNRPDTGEETAAPSATQQIISRQPAFFGSLDTRHAALFPARTHTASSPAQASNLTALRGALVPALWAVLRDQSTEIITAQQRCEARAALDILRRPSQNRNIKLRELRLRSSRPSAASRQSQAPACPAAP